MTPENKSTSDIFDLAKSAANQFASGNVIGGVGTAGILVTLLASTGIGGAFVKSPQMLGAAGILLVVFSGLLYLQKVKIQQDTLMVFAKGYFEVAAALTQKVTSDTVPANAVEHLASAIFKALPTNP